MTYSRALNVICLTIVISLVTTILVAWRFAVSLVAPIRQAVVAAEAIARGDLTQPLTSCGRDEAAQLLKSMQSI